MSWTRSQWVGGAARGAVAGAVLLLGIVAAQAQSAAADGPTGRIDFAAANLPPATVEVDLTQDVFGDLIGLGDAAVAGVAESLLQSAGANDNPDGLNLAADQLEAGRQILQIASQVVHEARVRVYDNLADKSEDTPAILSRFDGQLGADGWDTVVRVRDGDDSVRVSLVRSDGAVRGAFVVVADGNDVVLVNVVCDVSPENVKKLSAAATKIGLENGLGEVIKAKLHHKH
jgi:Domain of unknown function (DUF4252)